MKRTGVWLAACILLSAFVSLAYAGHPEIGGNSLDQGGTYCGGATVIPSGATLYSDSGFLDRDDDCLNPLSWPTNEVFYTFTPAITRTYIFRTQVFWPSTNVAIRIKANACCAGGITVAGTTNMVPAECDSGHTTYIRALLTAGTPYWIHVGDSTSTPRESRYLFTMMFVPCPDSVNTSLHTTPSTALELALNDSIMADSAFAGHPLWLRFTLDTADSVIITELGRSFGHCNSGFFPTCAINPLDAHFIVYCDTFGHALFDANRELCSSDAEARLCLPPGTYWVKVENFQGMAWVGWNFILTLRAFPASGGCPALSDSCGLETALCPDGSPADTLVILQPDSLPFPAPQTTSVCARLAINTGTRVVIPVPAAFNRPTVRVVAGCDGCAGGVNCVQATSWTVQDPAWNTFVPGVGFVNRIIPDVASAGCCVCIRLDFVLPVELQSFTAVAGNGEVTLNWTTASETDNDHFDIERDGAPVAVIRGAGGSSVQHSYRYTDSGLTNSRSYRYSLVGVNSEGNRLILDELHAVPIGMVPAITTYALHQNYPNPFNPTTEIRFDLVDAGYATLTIYNLIGQQVASLVSGDLSAGQHQIRFSAADLPSGIYLCRLAVNGFVDQKKMLLLK
ncbi:MAG TPA: T9SS type A sorting domain-containing protein [bacterium]|jgi:hypothetical protein